MNYILSLFSITLLFLSHTINASTCDSIGRVNKNGTDYIQYKVDKGNTLYGISRQYNISVELLKSSNNLEELAENQIILIPILSSNLTHKVQSHETLYSISKSTGVSVDDLKKINHLTDDNLSVGTLLFLSYPNSFSEPKRVVEFQNIHIVTKDETLYSISKMYHLSTDELKSINSLSDNNIELGQKLFITQPKHQTRSLISKSDVNLVSSNSLDLDQNFSEILSPYGNEGDILKITTKDMKTTYAKIVGKSIDDSIYATNKVFSSISCSKNNCKIHIKIWTEK